MRRWALGYGTDAALVEGEAVLRARGDVTRQARELAGDCLGQQRHGGHEGKTHGSGNQGVFNRGRARLVFHEAHELGHRGSPAELFVELDYVPDVTWPARLENLPVIAW